MRILGLEGTAWAASAAVYDTETGDLILESDPYVPDHGGIDPRAAADHMATALPGVLEAVLEDTGSVDVVAFSQGPGLGPCLRIVATAARAFAARRSLPLVGVNHMIAHLEVGRHYSGFDAPVCLNASGANAHVLGYQNGRYRVLGETMDTGVGNALDKFARHVGWSHPGGPKVEAAAEDGAYLELPYVVKGMDFSFSGITTAAQEAVDDGAAVEDVAYSLQETIFAVLTEVTERALSVTGADELVLGGGVGQNDRLTEMLTTMTDERGAVLFKPEPRLLRDNAGMIAILGAKMYAAGATLSVPEATVDSGYRPDEVPVTWREEEPVGRTAPDITETAVQGAEATVAVDDGTVHKHRLAKPYRHPRLDRSLRQARTSAEARLTSLARQAGVPTPVVRGVDPTAARLALQYVGEAELRDRLTTTAVEGVGGHLARLHDTGIVHGDPTVRNVRVDDDRVYLVDFGLGYHSDQPEDFAMDLHIFTQSLAGVKTADREVHVEALHAGYTDVAPGSHPVDAVFDRLEAIEGRGRYN